MPVQSPDKMINVLQLKMKSKSAAQAVIGRALFPSCHARARSAPLLAPCCVRLGIQPLPPSSFSAQDEALEIAGGREAGGTPEKGLAYLAKHCDVAVVTLGEKGCIVQERGGPVVEEPACSGVKVGGVVEQGSSSSSSSAAGLSMAEDKVGQGVKSTCQTQHEGVGKIQALHQKAPPAPASLSSSPAACWCSAQVVDATGAGDLFASGFLYGRLRGYPLQRCAQIGCMAGGAVVQTLGAEMSPANWEWLHHRCARARCVRCGAGRLQDGCGD